MQRKRLVIANNHFLIIGEYFVYRVDKGGFVAFGYKKLIAEQNIVAGGLQTVHFKIGKGDIPFFHGGLYIGIGKVHTKNITNYRVLYVIF